MQTVIRKIRGNMFLIRTVGIRDTIRYHRDRRNGVTIDYAKVFTPEQLAMIGEHMHPTPWEANREREQSKKK